MIYKIELKSTSTLKDLLEITHKYNAKIKNLNLSHNGFSMTIVTNMEIDNNECIRI